MKNRQTDQKTQKVSLQNNISHHRFFYTQRQNLYKTIDVSKSMSEMLYYKQFSVQSYFV